MSALLRLARPGDEAALATMHVAAWRETYAGLMPADFLASLSIERRTVQWRDAIADGETELTLVEDSGAIVGFAHAGPAREVSVADGEVYAVYLLRSHQGRALGRELMTRAAGFWLGRGGAALGLWVLRGNTPAYRFYDRLGGVVADRRSFTIGPAEYLEDAYLFRDLLRLASVSP